MSAALEAELAAARAAAEEGARLAEQEARRVAALESEISASKVEAAPSLLSSAPNLASSEGGGQPAAIEVGCIVRLPDGRSITVRGVRSGPGGVRVLGPGPDWIDGAGAVVARAEG